MGPKKPKPPPFKKRMVQRLMTAFPPPSEKRALNKGKRQFWRDLVEKLPRPFYRATVYEHMLRQYKKDVHTLRKEYLKDVTDQRQKAAQEKLKKEQEVRAGARAFSFDSRSRAVRTCSKPRSERGVR
jgi:hypothetical protein